MTPPERSLILSSGLLLGFLSCVIVVSLLASSAIAEHVVRGCRHHQLGNPYTPEQDYMAWSAWRARGGWAEPSQPCPRVHRSHRHNSSHVQ